MLFLRHTNPEISMKQPIRLLLSLLLASITAIQAQERKLPIDTTIVTKHSVTANGESFSYTAETGTQPVWD